MFLCVFGFGCFARALFNYLQQAFSKQVTHQSVCYNTHAFQHTMPVYRINQIILILLHFQMQTDLKRGISDQCKMIKLAPAPTV